VLPEGICTKTLWATNSDRACKRRSLGGSTPGRRNERALMRSTSVSSSKYKLEDERSISLSTCTRCAWHPSERQRYAQ